MKCELGRWLHSTYILGPVHFLSIPPVSRLLRVLTIKHLLINRFFDFALLDLLCIQFLQLFFSFKLPVDIDKLASQVANHFDFRHENLIKLLNVVCDIGVRLIDNLQERHVLFDDLDDGVYVSPMRRD